MFAFYFLLFVRFLCFVGASYFDDTISDELQCQCVPPHQCADNDDSANGQGLLDIRFENDPCPNHFHVCCHMPIGAAPPPTSKKCGLSKTAALDTRITSDSGKAQTGEFPWSVLIFDSAASNERNSFICGGSLIHPQVVITAGHCVAAATPKSLKVRAGELNIMKKNGAHQDRSVKEILVHSLYRAATLWNDIALLVLNRAIEVNDHVGFVCLPPLGTSLKIGEECVASGWGSGEMGRKRTSGVLRKVTLPLVGRGRCQKALRTSKLGRGFRLHKGFMCAGGEKNRDTCKGDGGSPLICPLVGETGRYVQVGVVSWGIGCGASNMPGVYVNVGLYEGWIGKQMSTRNFNTSYYKL